MKKTFAAALMASTLLSASAFAQTAAPATTETPAAAQTGTMGTGSAMTGTQTDAAGTTDQGTMNDMGTQTTASAAGASGSPFVTVDQTAAWRVSDLEGTDVYGSDGKSIGDIQDVLVDRQGQVTAVLVGVGGFLGIGEKNVAVSMNALEFQTEAQIDNGSTASTAMGTTAGTAGTTTATGGTTAGDMASTTDDDAADLERVVLNVTKEQLEQAPAYMDTDDAGATAPTTPAASGTGASTTTGGAMGTTAPAQ